MNVAKTQLMVLHRRRNQWKAQSVEVRIGGDVLVKQECVKYLGVRINKYILTGSCTYKVYVISA